MASAHPRGLWAMATGAPSGRDVIGIDLRRLDNGLIGWGLDSLEAEGIDTHALVTPTFHTQSGGYQQVCLHPSGRHVKSGNLRIDGRKIRWVDIKGDGGFVCLPPGPGRWWDPILGPDTRLAPLPAWAIMREPEPAPRVPGRYIPSSAKGDYTTAGEAKMDRLLAEIRSAPLQHQEETLNRGAFIIGQLVAGGEITAGYAAKLFDWLADEVQTLDPKRPWRPGQIRKKVDRAYRAGQRRPRRAAS
jgi:hypothetical protein